MALQWWDPVAERLHTETIPALELAVAVNPDLSPRFDPLEQVAVLAADHPWALSAGVIGIVAMFWAAFRWSPTGIRRMRRWRDARRDNERARFKRLLRACRDNAPAQIYNAYVLWGSSDIDLMPLLADAGDLVGELRRLQSALVGREPGWRADDLVRALQRARQAAGRSHREKVSQALPALNP
jgi:hypothetical protein